MNIHIKQNQVFLPNPPNFNLQQTFECGQCFRFRALGDGFYQGIAKRKNLLAQQTAEGITFHNATQPEFDQVWADFFDLGRDYGKVIKDLSFDTQIRAATPHADGIRILQQDVWEALCSFIISQNNNISRITKIIDAFCTLLGDPIEGGYAFPTSEAVFAAGIDGLAPIRAGFRAKYLFDAAEKVVTQQIALDTLPSLSYIEAKEQLMRIKGVGDKVSDCVLLFGLGFLEAFPRDVWVKRVIADYYGEDFTPAYFGKYAGIAQQYLFYYERNIKSADTHKQRVGV